jgi:hypothetical protein
MKKPTNLSLQQQQSLGQANELPADQNITNAQWAMSQYFLAPQSTQLLGILLQNCRVQNILF